MTRWATLAIGFLAFCAFPVTGPAQAQTGAGWTTLFDGKETAHVRNSEHTEGPVALQFGEGTVKFRKVAIKPL